MLLLNPRHAEYADVLERALYNAALVGIALDGYTFFYNNPLATTEAHHTRKPWFEVACCPANASEL